jgi:hypothetical protein
VKPLMTVEGNELFVERRRYSGKKTFTWVYLKRGSSFIVLGDPWPGVNPPKREIVEELGRLLEVGT